jgi:hypothetical protein
MRAERRARFVQIISLYFSNPKLLMRTSQALLAHAAKQTRLYLRLNYNIYDSPHPASFRRLPDKCEIAPDPAKAAQTPALPPGGETMLTSMSESCIHITAGSEMHPGSTGIVHIGTMAVDMPGPKVEVAIKIAFSRDEKKTLANEHQIYLHLHSRHVQGIPSILGLFADGADKEGPHVLLMSYAGISLSSMRDASNSAKYVVNPGPVYILISFAENHYSRR